MALSLASGSTQYLESAFQIFTAEPFTFSAWYYPLTTGAEHHLISIADVDTTNYHSLFISSGIGLGALTWDGSDAIAYSSSVITNKWQHCCAVFAAGNDRRCYLNGGDKGTNNTSKTVNNFDNLRIGVSADSTPYGYCNGRIAEIAIWRAILSDSEVVKLADGIHPKKVRLNDLVVFLTLSSYLLRDEIGGLQFVAYNDPVLYPSRQFSRFNPKFMQYVTSVVISGSTTWGHDTGVIETNILDFVGNWIGTGSIDGSGDVERLVLEPGQYMISNVVESGAVTVTLLQNYYDSDGDTVDLDYRHGATQAACEAASWNNYTVPFVSLGFVQVRVTSTQ